MSISINDGDVWVTTTVTGPRGRSRPVCAKVNLTIDKEGLHSQAEFTGPFGKTWYSSTTISFQEVIEVLRQKPGGLGSFIKLIPSDLVYMLKEIIKA